MNSCRAHGGSSPFAWCRSTPVLLVHMKTSPQAVSHYIPVCAIFSPASHRRPQRRPGAVRVGFGALALEKPSRFPMQVCTSGPSSHKDLPISRIPVYSRMSNIQSFLALKPPEKVQRLPWEVSVRWFGKARRASSSFRGLFQSIPVVPVHIKTSLEAVSQYVPSSTTPGMVLGLPRLVSVHWLRKARQVFSSFRFVPGHTSGPSSHEDLPVACIPV